MENSAIDCTTPEDRSSPEIAYFQLDKHKHAISTVLPDNNASILYDGHFSIHDPQNTHHGLVELEQFPNQYQREHHTNTGRLYDQHRHESRRI